MTRKRPAKRSSKPGKSVPRQRAVSTPPEDQALQDAIDEVLDESFPASDPPSWTVSRVGAPLRKRSDD
jgi:hypothetical protein